MFSMIDQMKYAFKNPKLIKQAANNLPFFSVGYKYTYLIQPHTMMPSIPREIRFKYLLNLRTAPYTDAKHPKGDQVHILT